MVADADLRRVREGSISRRALARELGIDEASVRRALAREAGPPDALLSEVNDPEEIPVIVRDYSNEAEHYVYPLGDVHLGAQKHHAQRWGEWLSYLESQPNRSMLGTGDFLNSAIIGSKSDVYDELMPAGAAKRLLRRQLQRLADEGRLDGMCPGNHEERIARAVGDCPIEDVTDFLGVPYFRAAALFIYLVGDVEYHVYTRHGTGNGQSLAQLSKSANTIAADVYVTGHTHRQAVTSDDYFIVMDGQVVRRHRYFVSSGSFLGLENYAAVRGYTPTRIGAPRIYLDGRGHDVHISI